MFLQKKKTQKHFYSILKVIFLIDRKDKPQFSQHSVIRPKAAKLEKKRDKSNYSMFSFRPKITFHKEHLKHIFQIIFFYISFAGRRPANYQ